MTADAWQEQVLLAKDVPNTAMQVDIDGDGRVNLPELEIAIARVRSGVTEEE